MTSAAGMGLPLAPKLANRRIAVAATAFGFSMSRALKLAMCV